MTKIKRLTEEEKQKTQAIIELYTAVQSEGSRAGYPTIVVRTTGCTHRCFFGEGGWCDSWYTSIHPEKARYGFNDIVKMYKDNPHIKDMMLTGGSPTMWPKLVNELTHLAHEEGIFITIETEGSHYIQTDYPINLISISPKFQNSVPVIGAETPQGKIVDERMIKQHNKFRLNYDAISKSILYHKDYHIKPVVGKDLKVLPEIEEFIETLAIKLIEGEGKLVSESNMKNTSKIIKDKTWLMPAGANRAQLMESYGPVMDLCRDEGYKFTPRPHIIAFDEQREV